MTRRTTEPGDRTARGDACERIPVIARRNPGITHQARKHADSVAAGLAAAEPRLGDIGAFAGVKAGFGDGPAILFGDSGEIPLLAERRISRFDYRIGWLACPGDLVVIGGPSNPDFESYQRGMLGFGGIRYLNVDPSDARPIRATPRICLHDEGPYRILRAHVAAGGGATLVAHITTGTIWALAARLSADTGLPLHVAGPPPLLSRRANDKLWFGRLAARALGEGAVPAKRAAHSAVALTRFVAKMAETRDRLVLKLPDSAGSVGNQVLDTAELRGRGARHIHARLAEILARRGWKGRFPMAVEVWDAEALKSPSVQIWIPLSDRGPPVMEGVFEQSLAGEARAFTGAVHADLPPPLDAALSGQAMTLALVLQRLGYHGRCSLDALLAGPSMDSARICWIECNARWGGVSVPMTLANRLANTTLTYAIVQDDSRPLTPRPFAEALRLAEAAPCDIRFLSPNILESGRGAHFLCYGADRAAALKGAQEVLRSLSS